MRDTDHTKKAPLYRNEIKVPRLHYHQHQTHAACRHMLIVHPSSAAERLHIPKLQIANADTDEQPQAHKCSVPRAVQPDIATQEPIQLQPLMG